MVLPSWDLTSGLAPGTEVGQTVLVWGFLEQQGRPCPGHLNQDQELRRRVPTQWNLRRSRRQSLRRKGYQLVERRGKEQPF